MTIRNLHPADELAMIRDDLKRLEKREAELRAGFLAGRLPLQGTTSRAEVHSHVRRTFRKERLPEAVLADPSLWEETVVLAVISVSPGDLRYRPPTDRTAPAGRHPVRPG